MRWWVVWVSKADKQFHAITAKTEFGANMTMMTLAKKDAVINGVNVNYADTAWCLEAPHKKIAIQICREEWEKNQLTEVSNANTDNCSSNSGSNDMGRCQEEDTPRLIPYTSHRGSSNQSVGVVHNTDRDSDADCKGQ